MKRWNRYQERKIIYYKEAAVDCELFKAHNMMGSKYKCFQFNEDSLFEKPVGPAFQNKLEYDQKADNGSNAKDSSRIKIKVYKIKAVQRLDENSYSKENNYWFYEDSGVIYDYELNFPVGKIERDENGNFVKLENDIYVIGDIIEIPKTQLYD